MPIHDWTRVNAGTFHAFHVAWIAQLQSALNAGVLPDGYYALAEQVAGGPIPDVLALHDAEAGPAIGEKSPSDDVSGVAVAEAPPRVAITIESSEAALLAARRRHLAIRHATGDRIIAFIEIVSPGNRESRMARDQFRDKASEALSQGIHLLVIELFPPNNIAPSGLSGLTFEWAMGKTYDPPDDRPLTLAAFAAAQTVTAFVEPTATGHLLIDMPLFLNPSHYVNIPLESTYTQAYQTLPKRWQSVLEPK